MSCSKPLKLLDLPSLAHDVIFSIMRIQDVYKLSKCSRRSRNAVKTFTKYQKYDFEVKILPLESFELRIRSDRFKKQFIHKFRQVRNLKRSHGPIVEKSFTIASDNWPIAKGAILHYLDVFTDSVNHLSVSGVKHVSEYTEFVKNATRLPIVSVDLHSYGVASDETYRYVLKEFKDVKKLDMAAYPSDEFRFDEMQPFECESVIIEYADWVTMGQLVRCFSNVETLRLGINPESSSITPQTMHEFFDEWRYGSKIRDLDLDCASTEIDLRSIFKNVPIVKVHRVEVRRRKTVFKDGECFLIRQEESGVEAVAYWGTRPNVCYRRVRLIFTTDFRLLRDDEKVEEEEKGVEEVSSDESTEDEEEDDDVDESSDEEDHL